MRILILLVLGLLSSTSAFSQETTDKRIICSIKKFTVAYEGMDRSFDADTVGLTQTPKELVIPADAKKSEDGKSLFWQNEEVWNLYYINEKAWHLAYTYYGKDGIVSVNAVRVCDEF
jgi:hypothetical protein